jgi:hypothetical protein
MQSKTAAAKQSIVNILRDLYPKLMSMNIRMYKVQIIIVQYVTLILKYLILI